MKIFSFEILKEVEKEELSYWKDFFIIKYGTIFPYGYNKCWNCSEAIRKIIEFELKSHQPNSISKYNFRLARKQRNHFKQFYKSLSLFSK